MRFVLLLGFSALSLFAVAAPLLRPVAVLEVPHVRALAFSPDGSFLAVAAGEEVILFSPGNWTQAGALRGHAGTVSDLVFLRSGRLATASWDGTVRLWDPKSGTVIGTIPVSRGASDILAVAVSPDEKVVVVGCVEEKTGLGMVMWYEVASGRLLRSRILSVAQKMAGGRDTQIYRVRAVRFDPQGTLLAAGSEDRLLRMWDRIGNTEILPPKEHAGTVYALAFSPDGQRLAAATWGRW